MELLDELKKEIDRHEEEYNSFEIEGDLHDKQVIINNFVFEILNKFEQRLSKLEKRPLLEAKAKLEILKK